VAERTLNHFSFFAFSDAYWSLAGAERAEFARTWLPQLRGSAEQVAVYQVFPAQAGADILVWSALPAETPEAAGTFFSCYARAVNAQRRLLQPIDERGQRAQADQRGRLTRQWRRVRQCAAQPVNAGAIRLHRPAQRTHQLATRQQARQQKVSDLA